MGVKLLGKIKIHEIAKKVGLASKEVLEAAKNLKIESKSHLSGVSEEEAKKIESFYFFRLCYLKSSKLFCKLKL